MQEAIAAFLLLVMATYWATEALPLPVTALIPVFYLPLTGIMTTEDVTMLYMKVRVSADFGVQWKSFCMQIQ